MDGDGRGSSATITSRSRGRRAKLECRDCQVVCELVVCPWRCLRSGQRCIYAYNDGESTYFGCLHKVFAPELDLEVFWDQGGGHARRSDPYGPLRVTGTPRHECPVSVAQAYCAEPNRRRCVNPRFLREVFSVRPRFEDPNLADQSVADHLGQ